MNKKTIVLCASAAILFAGCSQSTGHEKSETIKIGSIAPISGPAATYGEDVVYGYEYVVNKVNKAGGVNGKQIELVLEDGKCNGKDAVSAVQKLINIDKVEVIAGAGCSSETIAAGNIAQQAGVTMVSALSTSPEVSKVGDYIFRYYNDLDGGVAIGQFLAENNIENIAVVYENTDYGVAFANAVKDNFTGNVLVNEKFNSEEKDFSILAKKIDPETIEYIVFIPQTEATGLGFIKALQGEGLWEGQYQNRIMATETVVTQTLIDSLGKDANGIKGMRVPDTKDLSEKAANNASSVLANYTAKNSDVFVLFAADSMELIIEAIEEVGYDSEAIRNYIAGFGSAEKARETLFGSMYFDAEGDGQGVEYKVVEIVDGGFVTQK